MSIKCNRPEVVENSTEKEIPVKGNRFRRLQMKWELLSTKDLTVETPIFDGPQGDTMRAKYLNAFFLFSLYAFSMYNDYFCRRAIKSRIPRPVLSPVQPTQDAFSKRPMTATYRADSPTSPSGTNKIDQTLNK